MSFVIPSREGCINRIIYMQGLIALNKSIDEIGSRVCHDPMMRNFLMKLYEQIENELLNGTGMQIEYQCGNIDERLLDQYVSCACCLKHKRTSK